jgi:hypothetical protein
MTRKYDRRSSLNVKRREQHYGLSAIKTALPLHYLSIQELVIKCFNAGSYDLLRIKICKKNKYSVLTSQSFLQYERCIKKCGLGLMSQGKRPHSRPRCR